MKETQISICAWADESFGPSLSLPRSMARAAEELTEALVEATKGDAAKVIVEAADTLIVLARVGEATNHDLLELAAGRVEQLRTATAISRNEVMIAWASTAMISLGKALHAEQEHQPEQRNGAILGLVWDLAILAWAAGGDITEAVDAKMQINRSRTWAHDGTGHGYHVDNRAQ